MTRHLLLIGGQRCGTTYLHGLLQEHPEIAMARPARPEPKVFLSDELSGRGAEWYRSTYFAHASGEKILGEKSTSYLEDPAAATRAAAVLGDPLVLVLLRDPVARAISNWRFSTDNGLEKRPLDVALRESLEQESEWDPSATSVSPFAYLARGRYAEHLVPWLTTFGDAMQVHFLAELLEDDATLMGLYAGLDVDPGFRPEGRDRIANGSSGPAPHLPADLTAKLEGYFAASNQALAELLGRELPWWSGATLAATGSTDLLEAPERRAIAFNESAVEGRELDYVRASIRSGHPSSGGGFSARAEALLADATGAEEVLLTTSCTSALELSAMLLDLGPDDTVVVPSFTFTTTALAYAREGARLVYCDIEPHTLGMDPDHLATLLDEHVRAVVVVHYAGIACDLEGIQRVLADRPDIALVEDNAHALFGSWRGRPLGSIGRFAAQSFHETKNFTCGEGGALILNDAADVDRARVLHDKGTDRRAFLLGQVDKYSWKDTGSSFGLSDVLAAYLLAQLEQAAVIQAKRRAITEHYHHALSPQAERLGFTTMPADPPERESAFHMFYVLLQDRRQRDAVLRLLRDRGVQATFHYVPLHTSDAGRRFAARETACPVTTDVSDRLLRLPFHNNLTTDDLDRVAAAFLESVATSAE
ncbi:MAG: dTDP-4-amino-4,6-dideoxygalactose transaminase [Nocardioides sp.]